MVKNSIPITFSITKMYSGGEPQFVEGDVFRITIPLSEVATVTVGPASTTVGTQVTTQVKLDSEKLSALLEYCSTARSRKEMQDFCGIKTTEYFRKNIIKPMLEEGLILQTIPDKPNSRNQKYVAASKV